MVLPALLLSLPQLHSTAALPVLPPPPLAAAVAARDQVLMSSLAVKPGAIICLLLSKQGSEYYMKGCHHEIY